MKEQEKQIEEIILVVKEKMTDNASIDIDEDLVSFNGNDFDHIAEQTAEALYNAGYRQINEYNEVVSLTLDRVRKETTREILKQFAERLKNKFDHCVGVFITFITQTLLTNE